MRLVLGVAVGVCVGLAFSVVALTGTRQVGAVPCEEEPCDVPPCCNGDVNGDGDIDLSDPISLLMYLFEGGTEPPPIVCFPPTSACQLPPTGQTLCYDETGAVVDCADLDLPPQDGFYQSGCPPDGRFVDNGDGTVTDTCTNLMWEKSLPTQKLSWIAALQYAESLELGGANDWRLPNVKELQSIVDYGRSSPSAALIFAAQSSFYWTSTSFHSGPENAWVVNFQNGFVSSAPKGLPSFVRAVRTAEAAR